MDMIMECWKAGQKARLDPIFLFICCTAILLSGCSLAPKIKKIDYAAPAKSGLELGYVGVSVFNPVPWYQVKDKYKPKFKNESAEDLLDDVAPVVAQDYYGKLERSQSSLGLDYLGGVIDRTTTRTEDTVTDDGVSSYKDSYNTSDKVIRKTPGSLKNDTSVPDTKLSIEKKFDPGFDPAQKYRAALALYHRIETLNNYLDVPYGSKDEYAYLMRMQLTVSPYTRNQPFDLHSTISLETGEYLENLIQNERPSMIGKQLPGKTTNVEEKKKIESEIQGFKKFIELKTKSIQASMDQFKNNLNVSEKTNKMDLSCIDKNSDAVSELDYKIFPLLAADSLERVDTTRLNQIVSQISLSAKGRGGSVAAQAGYSSALEELQSIIGNKVNSLVSLTQTSQTDLVIRLNAGFNASTKNYALRERTFDVAFVVVVPKCVFYANESPNSDVDLRLIVNNQFKHAGKGYGIPLATKQEITNMSNRLYEDVKVTCLHEPDFKSFESQGGMITMLNEYLIGKRERLGCWVNDRSLYLEMRSAQRQLSLYNAKFTLIPLTPNLPDVNQVGTYADNKVQTTVELIAEKPLDLEAISAFFLSSDSEKFGARSIEQNGKILKLTFPSLRSLGYLTIPASYPKLKVSAYGDSEVIYPNLKMDLQASKLPEATTASFTLGKFSNKFNKNEEGANAVVVVKPKNQKTINGSIKVLKFTINGSELKKLLVLSSSAEDSGVSVIHDLSTNSAKVPVTDKYAHRLILASEDSPANEVVIIVTGLDDKGEVVSGEVAQIQFDK